MDPLTVPLVVLGIVFAGLILFRIRGLVGSVRRLVDALRADGRRPPAPKLPTDDRFRDVGDDGPRDGRPDPYA